MNNHKGETTLIILLALVLLGGGAYGFSKTKWFHGETKRANESTQTTEQLVGTSDERNAKAAAVFQKIGETNVEAPVSPQQKVVNRFVGIGLSLTGSPDPAYLLELERIKVAELSGKLAQADRMTATLLEDSDRLKRQYATALAAKRASDLALEQAAAQARGAEQQAFMFTVLAGGVGLLWLYTKLTHLSPGTLSTIVTDIRTGAHEPNQAIHAIDTATTPLQQVMTRGNVWFSDRLRKIFS